MTAGGQSPAVVLPDDEHNRELVRNVHPSGWVNPTPTGPYNLVVIGAGTAGLVTAAIAAGLGARVALGSQVTRVGRRGVEKVVSYAINGARQDLTVDEILVAVGMRSIARFSTARRRGSRAYASRRARIRSLSDAGRGAQASGQRVAEVDVDQ